MEGRLLKNVGQKVQGRDKMYLVVADYRSAVALVPLDSYGNAHVLNGHVQAYIVERDGLSEWLNKISCTY